MQASTAPFRRIIEDDLNVFIASVRFERIFCSSFLAKTVQDNRRVKDWATGPRDKIQLRPGSNALVNSTGLLGATFVVSDTQSTRLDELWTT